MAYDTDLSTCSSTGIWWKYDSTELSSVTSGTIYKTYGDLTDKEIKKATKNADTATLDLPCGYFVYIYYGNTATHDTATF